MTPSTPITELTVEDLMMLIRQAVNQAMSAQKTEPAPDEQPLNQWGILDIPPLSVGPWPDGLELISREEYYGDDGR